MSEADSPVWVEQGRVWALDVESGSVGILDIHTYGLSLDCRDDYVLWPATAGMVVRDVNGLYVRNQARPLPTTELCVRSRRELDGTCTDLGSPLCLTGRWGELRQDFDELLVDVPSGRPLDAGPLLRIPR